MSNPYRIKTRTQYSVDHNEDFYTNSRQKDFSSISKGTGKITKFYPKPTLSQTKPYKQKSKNIFISQDQVKLKVKESQKPLEHVKYFDKLEISCKLPPREHRQSRLSVATTFPNFGDNSRQIEEYEETKSLEWSKIKKSIPINFIQKLMVNCNPYVNVSVNFCTCDHPCKWATKWTSWIKQPQPFAYKRLKQTKTKFQVDLQIKKDLKRTQPECISFQIQSNLDKLEQVLQVYAKYDNQLEYVQGMNLITSTILYHVKNPQNTFWIFVNIMERKQLRQLYLNQFQLLFHHTKIVKKLLYLKVNDLYQYLEELEIEMDSFFIGWILSMMLKVVPLEFSHMVIDAFIKEGFLSIYKIIIAYLIYLKEELFIRKDSSDILHRLSPSFKNDKENWEEILLTADGLDITETEIKSITKSLKF